ncbi:MAG: hypothetical protein LBI86_08130, partial [Treponema sp.]|nr:hypothetical protein [Treponema sp.]
DRLLEIRKQLGTLQSDRAQLDLLNTPAETPGPTESDEPGPVKPAGDDKTQGRRLRELDDSYRIQKEMAARNGEDLLAIDAEWQAKRLALLETFIQEDVAARKEGVSWAAALDASLRSALAEGYGQISEQLDAVRTRLAELSSEQAVLSIDAAVSFADQHGVPLDEALKKIAEEARKAAGEELSNTEKLVREQDALNIKLEEGNVSGETAVSIRGRLAAVTGELAAADTRRQEALAREEEASRRLLAFDLDRISTTAQKTIDAVDKEIGAKKELGLFGKTEKETEKNALQERYNSLLEKQKALEEEYVRLRKSESPDDQARADALKGQIQEVAAETEAAGKEIQSSAESVAGAIAEKFSRIAGIIRDTVRGIADIAGGLIDNQAERDAQAAAERLAAIEQQKNATLNELDGELNDMREEHRRENEEREAEYQERMYEAQQGQYSRTIAELQGAFAMETNIEKLRELEKQLEAEKKKKREAAEQKKKEQEDKKRAEDQLRQENEALNKRNQLEWEFSAAQVTTENAAGAAAAEAARQKARWEKASTITTLSLQAAESVVKAAVAIAGMDYIGAAAYTLAAGIATGQAAVAGLAPEPASYIPQPLPPPPRKLAAGGIFMPSIGGTDILTAGGSRAVIAEANIPELYLPVTAENIDSLFKAAGVKNYREDSIVYAPVFDITLNNTENMTAEDLVDYLKNEWERDFVEFAEGAYKKYFVGTRT